MGLLSELFTWWNGQTFPVRLWTARKGVRVGEDSQGNLFYRSKDGARRWVIYNGEIEASRIDPEWHGWLHHTFQEPPTDQPLPRKSWEKPHLPNLTGTAEAFRPPGSVLRPAPKPRTDYDAWSPE